MDAQDITAFVKAVQNVFGMMFQLEINHEKPRLKEGQKSCYDVSGIIGMSGDVTGAVAISFPTDTAERLMSLFTGMEMTVEHEDFADAIGELVNIVTGSAKAEMDKSISISIPSVIIGKGHQITPQKNPPMIEIPFSCDCGEFMMEVAIMHQAAPVAECA